MNLRPADTASPPSGGGPLWLTILGLLGLLISERVLVDPDLGTPLWWTGVALLATATLWRLRLARTSHGATQSAETALLIGHFSTLVGALLLTMAGRYGQQWFGWTSETMTSTAVSGAAWLVFAPACLATLAMERAWLHMPTSASVEFQRLKGAGVSAAALGLSVVFLFGVNYTASKRDWRKDVTFFKTTSPSEATRSLVQSMEEPVTMVLFFAPVSDVLSEARPYFDDLQGLSPHLHLQVTDHALEPELARRFRVRDNGFVLLVRGAPDKLHNVDKTPASERFELGTDLARARRNLRKLDSIFHKRFNKLNHKPKRIRFTSGHSERSRRGAKGDQRSQRLQLLHTLLQRLNITSDDLGISDGLANLIPSDTSAVVVAGPRERLMDEEVDTLLRYVQGGGRLLVFADPPRDGARSDGLDRLFERLGVRRARGTVASVSHHMRSAFTRADRALVYSNTFSSHPSVSTASRNSSRVAAVFTRGASFERRKGAPAHAKITFPVRSTQDFWRDLDGDLKRSKSEPLGQLNLMAAVTLPAAQTTTDAGNKEGRVVIIGDGDFATDARLKVSGNALVVVDTLRWLIGDEKLTGDVTSEEDVAIEHRKDADRLWFYATSFGLPLPLLLMALWMGRRRRGGGR